MPRGLNRTDLNKTGISYRNGTPVTLPYEFGNVVTWPTPDPAHFGNPVTDGNDPTQFGNTVDWQTPDPTHFGNAVTTTPPPPAVAGFELEDGSGVILLESGGILLLEVQ